MPEISFDETKSRWALTTPATSYVLGWDGAALRHLYWGPALTRPQAGTLPQPRPARWLDGEGGNEEIAVEGGARFGPAGLRARFADGTRGLRLDYSGHEVSGLELLINLRDREYPLQVDVRYRLFEGSDVVERSLTVRNAGDRDPIALARADSAC
jgi:alpha-galactosidase